MKNMYKLLGIIAMAAIIGITMTACELEEEPDFLDAITLSTSTPTQAALNAGGINSTEYNAILAAAGEGGYRGWLIDSDGDLFMAWEGRTLQQSNNVHAALITVGEPFYHDYYETDDSFEGYKISAGTLLVWIGVDL